MKKIKHGCQECKKYTSCQCFFGIPPRLQNIPHEIELCIERICVLQQILRDICEEPMPRKKKKLKFPVWKED